MPSAKQRFNARRLTKIAVKKPADERIDACKPFSDALIACWRISGVDSRACASLVASLAACVAAKRVAPKCDTFGDVNRVIRKFLDRR